MHPNAPEFKARCLYRVSLNNENKMRIRKLALLAAAASVSLAAPVLAADAIIEQPLSRYG